MIGNPDGSQLSIEKQPRNPDSRKQENPICLIRTSAAMALDDLLPVS
jgi:hypothetical protein